MPSHDTARPTMEAPDVYPEGWRPHEVTGRNGWRIGSMLIRDDLPDDCYATFTIETYPPTSDAPLGRPGQYRRIVICRSADDRYPTWEMMRDFIRSCGLFDAGRDVFMLLPDERHITIRKSAFHWWQEDGETA